MSELKFKSISVDKEKKVIVFRIKGGVWLRLFSDKVTKTGVKARQFYLHVPKDVAAAINEEVKQVMGAVYDNGFNIQEDEYANTSTGIVAYEELFAKLPERESIFAEDIVFRFGETTVNKSKKLSKSILDIKVGENKRNWFASDTDFFGDDPAEVEAVDVENKVEDDLPF